VSETPGGELTIKEVRAALATRVVPAVYGISLPLSTRKRLTLTTRCCVEVEVDPETVFPGPLDRLEEVRPSHSLEERLFRPSGDGPVRQRNPNPVETGCSDLGKVLFGDEGVVVLGHGGGEVGAHVLG